MLAENSKILVFFTSTTSVQTITKQPRVDLGQMDEHHPEISDTASS
jgi:hypothetical protein